MTTKQWDVIVIGAGMAGLKAAHDLHLQGKSVLVLEARNRIGGRIHTVRDVAAIPLELGAELIHTKNAHTWELVRQHGITTQEQGAFMPVGSAAKSSQAMDEEEVFTHLERQVKRVGLPYATENMADYLKRLGMNTANYPPSFQLIEYDTESLDKWDARFLTKLITHHANQHYGNSDYRVPHGYNTLLSHLLAGFEVQLNTLVTEIKWDKKGVEVITQENAYAGRTLIITVPPLVLQQHPITFSPPLPATKWQAIQAFGRCDIVKIHLVFDHAVLPSAVGSLIDPEGNPPIWWRGNTQGKIEGEVLVGWAASDNARKLLAMDTSTAIETVLNSLRRSLNDASLQPQHAHLQHWNDDPFAAGAYPFVMTGGDGAIEALAQPLGNVLFWAGAATDLELATVHGAYASGQRVAKEVMRVLG